MRGARRIEARKNVFERGDSPVASAESDTTCQHEERIAARTSCDEMENDVVRVLSEMMQKARNSRTNRRKKTIPRRTKGYDRVRNWAKEICTHGHLLRKLRWIDDPELLNFALSRRQTTHGNNLPFSTRHLLRNLRWIDDPETLPRRQTTHGNNLEILGYRSST